jgi:hypothetical protein
MDSIKTGFSCGFQGFPQFSPTKISEIMGVYWVFTVFLVKKKVGKWVSGV